MIRQSMLRVVVSYPLWPSFDALVEQHGTDARFARFDRGTIPWHCLDRLPT